MGRERERERDGESASLFISILLSLSLCVSLLITFSGVSQPLLRLCLTSARLSVSGGRSRAAERRGGTCKQSCLEICSRLCFHCLWIIVRISSRVLFATYVCACVCVQIRRRRCVRTEKKKNTTQCPITHACIALQASFVCKSKVMEKKDKAGERGHRK